ncbi:class A beta-lactamase-related serine hydrolase [Pseudonocardiaceae bacterium YIM PH 21723]|nr:class A beta-lactamase-related serine hydrolase [Pseudonocardiaceae bacterium YIM PH 21723]
MTVAVTAALLGVPAATAAPAPTGSGCDTGPIRSALTRLERVGAGIAVTVRSPRCGVRSTGVGLADRWTGRTVTGDEHSRIGSDTKAWTATVVLQLVGEGRLRLEDTVEDHLPGLIRTEHYDGRTITVRQLLQHTSGLPDYLDAPFWEEDHRWEHIEPLWTVHQALALPPPARTPSGFAYSNTGYNLAGLIVRQVTGRDIRTEIEQRIIRPLGLRETSWPGDRVNITWPDLRTATTEWNTSEADASGELISTGADATAFWTALITGRLLQPAQLTEMRRTVPDDSGTDYGLGVEWYRRIPGLDAWGHSGSMASGHNFRNAITSDGGRAVTLLIGTEDFDAVGVDAVIDDLLRDLR